MITEFWTYWNESPFFIISVEPPGEIMMYLPPNKPWLTTATELSSGSLVPLSMLKVRMACMYSGSSRILETVPTLTPDSQTGAFSAMPSTLVKLASSA